MQDFPGNSQRTRNRPQAPPPVERANIEQVTTAEKRKPGLGRRFKETFIIASPRETVEFMVAETVIPAIRDMMFDAFESGLQRMIYG